jgi:hypothetical protein
MRWIFKQKEKTLNDKAKEEAQKMIASPPVRDYLVALMGELVREGIYLSPEKQIGAKFTVELLSKEIEKGDALFRK